MKHLRAINQKARLIEHTLIERGDDAHALAPDVPFGCTTIMAPGWEADSGSGTYGL